MIERVLEQEKAIQKVLCDDRKLAHLIPTWQDIDVLESVSRALSPLGDFTDMLSGESNVTISAINPVLQVLRSEVLVDNEEDTELTKDIKNRILAYLEEKYSEPDVAGLINLACFLDPRFIDEYIPTSAEATIVKDQLAREGVELVENAETNATTDVSQNQESTNNGDALTSKKRKLGSLLKAAKPQKSVDKTPETIIKEEIKEYLKSPKPDPESNPLEWWKLHSPTYPRLAILARKYLYICASSSSSERVFSVSGHVASK